MDTDAFLSFANEAFYAAFAARDPVAMDALWARHVPVSCIHPGWNPLFGRERIMESWTAILTNPAAPKISCHVAATHRLNEHAGVVLCFEIISDAVLAATNIFVREKTDWRMAHHQAAAVTAPPSADLQMPTRLQ